MALAQLVELKAYADANGITLVGATPEPTAQQMVARKVVESNTAVAAAQAELAAAQAAVAKLTGSINTPPATLPAADPPWMPTDAELEASLQRSYDNDVADSKKRHGPTETPGCTLCVTCNYLFRKGSTAVSKPKHATHKMYVFPDGAAS